MTESIPTVENDATDAWAMFKTFWTDEIFENIRACTNMKL
jgi:hypothetical protein